MWGCLMGNICKLVGYISKIDKILSKPYFIYYDKEKQSLRYYKLLDEYVCVIVKLSKKDNYIYIQFIQ